jgi:succinyl-CoA synthetase beta subunit
VHAGGRGKGTFIGSGADFGGVKYLTSREKVGSVAKTMLAFPLQTKQTGPEGQKVSTLLVQKAADIAKEYYLGMVLDRASGLPVMMASSEGGVDIEEVAAHSPEKILKEPVSPELGLLPFQARKLAFELGFKGDQVTQAEGIMRALSKVFLAKDCSIAEINPLVVTKEGCVEALDAKMVFDENALFRHPEIAALRDETEEDPKELAAQIRSYDFAMVDAGAGVAMDISIIKDFDDDFETRNWKNKSQAKQLISQAKQMIATNPTKQKLRPIISELFKLLPDSERPKQTGNETEFPTQS